MKVKAAFCLAVLLLQPDACWAEDSSLLFSRITICGDLPCSVHFFQEFYPGRDLSERLFFWRSSESSGDSFEGHVEPNDQPNDQPSDHGPKEKDVWEDESPPPLSWGFAGLFTALAIIIRRKMKPRPIRRPARPLVVNLHGTQA